MDFVQFTFQAIEKLENARTAQSVKDLIFALVVPDETGFFKKGKMF